MTHRFNEVRISLKSFHVIPIGKKIFNMPRYFFTYTNIQILLKLRLVGLLHILIVPLGGGYC
jgi:hypothetical protein